MSELLAAELAAGGLALLLAGAIAGVAVALARCDGETAPAGFETDERDSHFREDLDPSDWDPIWDEEPRPGTGARTMREGL